MAQLAGIPKSVVAAAKRKLAQLENNQLSQHSNQPDMFVSAPVPVDAQQHAVVSELEAIQPDDLTPKQALELLYQLKKLL